MNLNSIQSHIDSVLPQLAKMDGKYVQAIIVELSDDRRKAMFTARSVRPKDRRIVFVAETIEWDFAKEEPYASQIREYQKRVEDFLAENPPPHVDASRIVRVSTRPAAPVRPIFTQREIDVMRAAIECFAPVTASWSGVGSNTASWEVMMTEEMERKILTNGSKRTDNKGT